MIRQIEPSYEYPSAVSFISWHLQGDKFNVVDAANKFPGAGLNKGGHAYAKTEANKIYIWSEQIAALTEQQNI